MWQRSTFPLNKDTLENELKFHCRGTFKFLGFYTLLGKDDNSHIRGQEITVM